MAIPHDPPRSAVFGPAAAFASRDFRKYQLGRLLVIMGAEAQAVAVAWQIYAITHRAIDLGYTGLALFLPGILFLIISGHTRTAMIGAMSSWSATRCNVFAPGLCSICRGLERSM